MQQHINQNYRFKSYFLNIRFLLFSVDQGNDISFDYKFRTMIGADGSMFWGPGMKWRTSCDVDLTYFPFDTQNCTVKFVNWIYNKQLVNFVKYSPEVDLSFFQENGEWELIKTYVDDSEKYVYEDVEMPSIAFTITLQRIPTYFVLNVIVPCVILTAMCAMVFLLPSESGEKVSFGTTLLLSYTVLILMISDITPRSGTKIPLLCMYKLNIFSSLERVSI